MPQVQPQNQTESPQLTRLLQWLDDINAHGLAEPLIVPAHIVLLDVPLQTPRHDLAVLERVEVLLAVVPHHGGPQAGVVRVVGARLAVAGHPIFEGGVRVDLHQEDAEFEEDVEDVEDGHGGAEGGVGRGLRVEDLFQEGWRM
jgi:hypothetical protein